MSRTQGKRCDSCGLVIQGPPSTRSRVGDKQFCHRPGCRVAARVARKMLYVENVITEALQVLVMMGNKP